MSEFVQSRFSPEFRQATVARLEGGERADDLAAELGVHKSRIYRWRQAERGELPASGRRAATRAAAKAQAGEALAALAAVMTGEGSNASRIAAANAILDRALGKPGQLAAAKPSRKARVTRIERIIVYPREEEA